MAIKFMLSVVMGLPIATLTLRHFMTLPFGPHLDALCPGYKGTDLTGIVSIDNLLCKVINIFTHAINDPLGNIISWLLLGLFASVLAIWAIEGSRVKANALLGAVALWGMAANLFTVSALIFALWIPMYYFCYGDNNSNIPDYSIKSARATAILIAVLAGFVIPSMVMLLAGEPFSHTQTVAITLWQFAPLVVAPIYLFSTSTFACMEEPMESRINYQAQQKRRVADQKSAVETVHLVLGVMNAICYYVLLFRAGGRGLLNVETFVDLWTLYRDKLTAMSIEQTGFISASNFFLVDLVICWAGCAFWSLLESGFSGLLVLVVGSIFTGPGGGVSLYAAYRESYVQDNDRLVVKSE
ncbi:hypothetical protein BDA99DRAFT_501666 [Phascolomyces articulosus]|uniref:Uncharacterized protein n=1 Tax=Phascolomyces articulosus TaxID=60185 RepID=A0AAD5KG72_9FUNG|nr:hypothetical protein BDA99DRAFT_501666 [Phascolomyces articulosus]